MEEIETMEAREAMEQVRQMWENLVSMSLPPPEGTVVLAGCSGPRNRLPDSSKVILAGFVLEILQLKLVAGLNYIKAIPTPVWNRKRF
jgi:hypothetical protein